MKDFAEPGATPEQALESGAVEKFLTHLRAENEKLEVGSEERENKSKVIAGLQSDLAEFNRQTQAASKQGVSRETAIRLEHPVGAFEKAISQRAAGQTLMRAEQGLSNIAETGLSLADRAFGAGRMSAKLHQDKKARDAFLTAAEQGGDIQAMLGETGSRIFNGVTSSVAKNAAIGAVAGPMAVYSMIAGESYDDALEEARVNGISGVNAQIYAGTKGSVEAGLSMLFGKVAKKLGIETLEESFSPGVRRAVSNMVSKQIGNKLPKLAQEIAGVGMESGEEFLIDAVQQGVELTAGTSQQFNFGRLLEATIAGAGARGSVGSAKIVSQALRKIPVANIEETVKGVAVAEQALETARAAEAQPAVPAQQQAAATLASPEDQAAFEAIAAHQVQVEGQAGARGLNNALTFIRSATPEMLQAAAKPLTAKEFQTLTGIKKTSELFRAAFRDTLQLYQGVTKHQFTAPDGSAYEAGQTDVTGQPSTPAPRVTAAPVVEAVGKSKSRITVKTETGEQQFFVKNKDVQGMLDSLAARRQPPAQPADQPVTTQAVPHPPSPPTHYQAASQGEKLAAVKTWLKDNFTSAGLRNAEIDQANDRRLGQLGSGLLEIEHNRVDFDAAVKAEFGGRNKLTAAEVIKLDDALKGRPTDLPQSILEAIEPMRAHVDSISRQLLDSGVADPESELGLTIDENMGSYLTRTYRKHEQKNWGQLVKKDAALMDRMRSWLRAEFPNEAADMTEWRLNVLLDKDSAAAKMPAGATKQDRDFASVLKERKDLPDVLREAYGEYRDPWSNYTKSAAKMVNLLAHKQFMADVKAAGLATGFLSDENTPRPQNYRQIEAAQTPRLAELNGLYTDPETAKALQELFSADTHSTFYRYVSKLSSMAKWSATVGNSKVHVRNFIGNIQFAMANGDLLSSPETWGKAAKATTDHIFHHGGDANQRAYLQRLAELGLVDSNVDVGDVRAMAGEMADLDGAPKPGLFGTAENAVTGLNRMYAAGDAFWKVLAFENKKAQYAKAYPDATYERVESLAAEDVKAHYPTYSKLSKGVRKISQFPLAAPFISFPAESIRTLKNTLTTIGHEIKSDNPAVKEMGMKRAVGLMASFSLVPAISMISKAIVGITAQEEEDVRRFQPPWSANAQFLYLGKGDGNYDLLDLSFLDARSIISKPLIAALKADDLGDRVDHAVSELVSPLGEDLFFGRVQSVLRNRDATGRPVFNEQAPESEKARQVGWYLGEPLVPGTFAQLDRIRRGMAGEVSRGGKVYDAPLEAAAALGMRVSSTDVQQSFNFRSVDSAIAMSHAEYGITQVASSRGTITPGQLARAYLTYNQQLAKQTRDWHEMAMGAIRLGVPRHQVFDTLRTTAGEQKAKMIMAGRYLAYRPSDEMMRIIASRPQGRQRALQIIQLTRETDEKIAAELQMQ